MCLLFVTSAEFRRQWELQGARHPYVLTAIFSAFLELSTTLTIALTSRNARAVTAGNWAGVSNVYADRFSRQMANLENKFEDYICGSLSFTITALWESSDQCKALQRSTKATTSALKREFGRTSGGLGASTDTKRAATVSELQQRAEGKGGDIVCTLPHGERMPLPGGMVIHGKKPCAPYYRDGHVCKNSACRFAHVPINDCPPDVQKGWKAHVNTYACLTFNLARVTCGIVDTGIGSKEVGQKRPAK